MKEKALPKARRIDEPVSELEVVVPALRCPYCHDACAPRDSVVCRDCLARHHGECWSERGACSACNASVRLVVEERAALSREEMVDLIRRGRSAEVEQGFVASGLTAEEALRETASVAYQELAALGPRSGSSLARWAFGLQSLWLGILSVTVSIDDAEDSVWVGLALLLVNLAALGGARLLRKPSASTDLLRQASLVVVAASSTMMLVVTLDIPAHRGSPALGALGLVLAAVSAVFAVRSRR